MVSVWLKMAVLHRAAQLGTRTVGSLRSGRANTCERQEMGSNKEQKNK